jgi:nitrite reductase/ring-hydroxylating ferredoxin subunit
MISAEKNALMTQVGPDRPAGRLLRAYWQPVALADELVPERPLKALRLLGQDLVLFRDAAGRLGLVDRDCPHRGADLAYGRLEDGGLRCPFHGWLFDVDGRCLETPGEPPGSKLCSQIRQGSYPIVERSGIIFGYLGTDAPPAFPEFDCFLAPHTHTFAFKGLIECNWLQALEVGLDPAHASFLHRFFEDEDTSQAYGRQFRSASMGTDMPMTRVLREYVNPTIEVEPTNYGLRIVAQREIDADRTHVRVTNLTFPQAFVIPMSEEMTISQWHVPVDDVSCYWYAIFTSFGAPVDHDFMRAQRLELYELPDYRPRLGRANNYGFDLKQQQTQTYTGMGHDINVHDQWAIESQGRIQDRTREHLGQSDKAIVAYRRLLLAAIEDVAAGRRPMMTPTADDASGLRGPPAIDGICDPAHAREYWVQLDGARRAGAAWSQLAPAS